MITDAMELAPDRSGRKSFLSGRSRAPLTGRESELASLMARVKTASLGEPGVVLVSGEPGVGKTRLLTELCGQAATEGWQVLLGHAYDSEGMPPYLPFIEALQGYVQACPLEQLKAQLGEGATEVALILPDIRRRLPGDSGSGELDAESARYHLFESISEFVFAVAKASAGGLLLCLEDLQWADDSTLLLLEHLCRRLESERVLILATYRDTDLDVGQHLARTLEQLTRQGVSQRIDLKRLNAEAVAMVLASLGGSEPPASLVDAVYSETEGNPFFVLEVFNYLTEEGRLFDAAGLWQSDLDVGPTEVPQSVKLVIGRRMERLSDETRQLLNLASVIGRSFSYEILRALHANEEASLLDSLDEAGRMNLLTSDPAGRYSFVHELTRQVLYGALSVPRRQLHHLRVAEALEQLYAEDLSPHFPTLASQYAAAGPSHGEKTIAYAVRAAEASREVYAWQEAASYYQSALTILEARGDHRTSQYCDLLLAQGEALVGMGAREGILNEVAPAALAAAQALGDDRRAFAACKLVIDATETPGDWLQVAERYVGNDPHAQIVVNIPKSTRALHDGHYGEARSLLLNALDLARGLDDPEAPLDIASLAIRIGVLSEDEEAELFARMLRLPRGALPAGVLANFGLDSLMTYLQAGERTKAAEERSELSRLARQTRHQQIKISAAAGDALFEMMDGRLGEAVKRATDLTGTFPHIWQGRLAGWLGDREALEKELTWNDRRQQGSAIMRRAYFLAQLGRLDEARQALDDLPIRFFEPPDKVISFGLTSLLLETVSISEDLAHAEVLLQMLSNGKRYLAKPQAVLVPRHLGRLAALLGERERARDLYTEALNFCEAINHRPELASTRLDLAQLLLNFYPDERDESMSLLVLASAEFEAMGMLPWLQKAQALLIRPRGRDKAVPAYPDGLSEREVEVLRLIATGKSNPEIAVELTLSLNTVQRHVANILSKTNLANRTAAASYAHQNGLT